MDIPKKTAVELLKELLDEHGLTYTQFGERMGYEQAYTAAYEMLDGGKFGPRRQRRVIEEFGLRSDHFSDPDRTVFRRRHFRDVYEKFLQTDIGRATSPDNLKSIRGYQVHGNRLATVQLLQAIAVAIEDKGRYSDEQLAAAVERGDRLDRLKKPIATDDPPASEIARAKKALKEPDAKPVRKHSAGKKSASKKRKAKKKPPTTPKG